MLIQFISLNYREENQSQGERKGECISLDYQGINLKYTEIPKMNIKHKTQNQ